MGSHFASMRVLNLNPVEYRNFYYKTNNKLTRLLATGNKQVHFGRRVFPDSHFGSFYSQNLFLDPQISGARVLSDEYTVEPRWLDTNGSFTMAN